ncbi:hypothetical protein IV203_026785 [Nitzschia inconspicua]|uniref:Uncharacterized protein n=1 Tax=Nitzschia inconspicua TaxID=303405 RepID=A0A9K3LJA5_9STRA|nr:hypothetical protein IV203_026785 [Nitzschia inconspicua]
MPRLGSSAGGSSPPRRRHSPISPLQHLFGRNSRPLSLRNIFLFLAAFFVMRNLLTRDYRNEEIKYLRESGMSEEQLHRFVPKSPEEQRKYVQDKTNDVEKMKRDIAYLLNEVAELKARSMTANHSQQQPLDHKQEDNMVGDVVNAQQPPQNLSVGGGGRDDALKAMDKLHAEKRQLQEEKLLQNNPGFRASKRLKDMTEEEIQKALKK